MTLHFSLKTESGAEVQPLVSPRELTALIQDLRSTNPWPGFQKVATLLLILTALCWIIFGTESLWVFLTSSIVFAIFYASLLITTHDASHGTLTGLKSFDAIFPRVISILPFWPHETYKEIHKLHHKMNGVELEDPERTHWTFEEYSKATMVEKLYSRYQVFMRTFVFAGFGLLVEMLRDGLKFGKHSASVRRALKRDAITLILGFGSLVALSIHFGVFWKFAGLYLILERVTGGILQTRNTLEHYGLWGKMPNYFETQIFNCRNIKTSKFMSWYFNGLNFHSVHHAFPNIPFYHLETAHKRVQELYTSKNRPLLEDSGYARTFLKILVNPCLVNSPQDRNAQDLLGSQSPQLAEVILHSVKSLSALRPAQNAKAWIQAVQKKLGSFPFAG